MIKRFMLAALLAAAVLPAAGAQAATAVVYKNIGGYYVNGPDVVSVFGITQDDYVADTHYAYAQVSVQTANGSDSGVGVLDVALDPTGTLGHLSGTIQGTAGPITVDAIYLSLTLATDLPPSAYVTKIPGQPQVTGAYYWNRLVGEFATASVSSAVGDVDASGAVANAYFQLGFTVP